MKNSVVFIFDGIFESVVGGEQLAGLRAAGVDIRVISKKCKITDYAPLQDGATRKILCINPDFVDWNFTADDYKDIPGLQLIISSSDNISWLDTAYADSHGIRYDALDNLTTEYAAVAEYAITIMMSLARNIPRLSRDGFPLDYAHDFVKYQGMDIAGKTAGIIGLGNIGGAIANRCSGLGMKVTHWSRSEKTGEGYEYRELDDLLSRSDVIFPTLKPNAETRTMLPNKRLAHIKPDALVVSVVSGLIDDAYLARRVAEQRLFGFGYGADPNTFADYRGNVWAVPDYAWATKTNMSQSYEQFVRKIMQAIESPGR